MQKRPRGEYVPSSQEAHTSLSVLSSRYWYCPLWQKLHDAEPMPAKRPVVQFVQVVEPVSFVAYVLMGQASQLSALVAAE